MPVVYNEHPGWKTVQGLQHLSEVMARSLERTRARQEERMSRDLEIGIELMKRDPRTASSVGAELVAKYGKRMPWLSSAVKMFETEGASLKVGEEAYRGFVDAVGTEADFAEQRLAQAQAQPDAFPISLGPMGGGAARPFQMPNVMKPQAVASAQAGMDPAAVADSTLKKYDPQRAVLAHNYARAHEDKLYFPHMESFDRGKLPASAYALEFRDRLTAPARDALPALIGLEEKPAARIAREDTQAFNAQQLEERGRQATEAETRRQTHRVTNEILRQRGQERAHQNRLDLKGGEDGDDIKLAQNFPAALKWVEDRAGKPVDARHVQAIRDLALKNAQTSDDGNATFADIAATYGEMIADGIDPALALATVRGESQAVKHDGRRWVLQAPVTVVAPQRYGSSSSKGGPGFWQRARERVRSMRP